jgi:PAT family beta-lactamase induction signal transducer AmpG
MTDPPGLPAQPLWRQRKILALVLIGFGSGLPYNLIRDTLQAWMRTEGLDLGTITWFSLVSLPFTVKFLWAPAMDRYVPPFLGRRRGWLVITQLALIVAIAAMSLQDPRRSLELLAVSAICLAFFSACQDIVADAYRADVLSQREMGAGASIFVVGYRVALLATGALAFILADRMPWPTVYLVMALLMVVGLTGTALAPEPASAEAPPRTFVDAVILPFQDFVQRGGVWKAALVLVFIALFKAPDAFVATLATPFLIDQRFSQTDIGAIRGGIGIVATILGGVIAGSVIGRIGINRTLWIAGILQALSNLAYYGLALAGTRNSVMAATMVIENLCFGFAGTAFVAFLMSLCSVRFSATQYALLSSLQAFSGGVLVGPAGDVAEATGWPTYFLLTVAAAIPGLLLLPFFAPWGRESPTLAARHSGETVEAS